MKAEAYVINASQLAEYLKNADWKYWVVETPHRLIYEAPSHDPQPDESVALHFLAGRGFDDRGEFRWWRGENPAEIHATIICDEGWVSPTDNWKPTDGKDDENLIPEVPDRTCMVWGDKAGSSDDWDDPRRKISDELNAFFQNNDENGPYRGITVRHYLDRETRELVLWRCVKPVPMNVTDDKGAQQ